MEIIDLTRPLGPATPVFPGDPPVSLERVAAHETKGYQVTRICIGSHAGTHLDAPRHFFPDGPTLSDYPLSRLVSEGIVIDVREPPSENVGRDRLAKLLQESPVSLGEFVLLWTGARRAGAGLSLEAAALLAEIGVGLLGTDAADLDDTETYPIHRLLLSAGVLIAENLCNLESLGPGRAQFAFLPLAIQGTDGAPVRVAAWKLDD